MRESKQPKKPVRATPDKLVKPKGKSAVELSEEALEKTTGGSLPLKLQDKW